MCKVSKHARIFEPKTTLWVVCVFSTIYRSWASLHITNSEKSQLSQKRVFGPVTSLTPPHNTHPHAHTPIPEFSGWISPSKNSVENVFLNRSHRSHHHKTPPNTSTHTHTRYHTAVSHNSADAGSAFITAAAPRRKSARRIPSSARQQRVSYDGGSARYRCHLANNGYACCSLGGSRLSATPRT